MEELYIKGNADAWDQQVLSLMSSTFVRIMEADGDTHLAWKFLLNKFEVSEQKQESLTDMT